MFNETPNKIMGYVDYIGWIKKGPLADLWKTFSKKEEDEL